jgi:flagellar assembly protein FliH
MVAQKFTFERAFPETANRIVPLEQREPTLTVSEHEKLLQAAVANARIDAFIEGKTAANDEETARLARAMESVSMALDQLRHELADIHAMASHEAIRFAHDIAKKLAGKLLDNAPMTVIENVAREIFDDLRGQPHVAVRVAPELIDITKEKLSSIARERGFEGRLIVMGEPEIGPGDVRIEWADGGIIRDRARVEQTVAMGVERALMLDAGMKQSGVL